MGRLLILKKDPSIIADFQNAGLFTSFACAALCEDAEHYYVTLIPSAERSPAYETLIQHWQPYIVSALTSVHGSSRQPAQDANYRYKLAHFPIIHLPAVQQFYQKHHSTELDELMLNYCRRYIDYDFIDAEQQSLFVFVKEVDSNEPLPPIEQFPGADRHPEFLADLHELVTQHLQAPTKLLPLVCIDNQNLLKQFSPGLFHRRQHAASAKTTATHPSFQP